MKGNLKIIVVDEKLGRFEWEMPATLQKNISEIGRISREEMGFSEEESSEVERIYLEQLQNLVQSYLHLLIEVSIGGGPSSIILTEMVKVGLREMSSTALEVLKSSDKSR